MTRSHTNIHNIGQDKVLKKIVLKLVVTQFIAVEERKI